MLYAALVFLILTLVFAVMGFGLMAGELAAVAQILFVVFLVLFIVTLLFGGMERPR